MEAQRPQIAKDIWSKKYRVGKHRSIQFEELLRSGYTPNNSPGVKEKHRPMQQRRNPTKESTHSQPTNSPVYARRHTSKGKFSTINGAEEIQAVYAKD